MAQGPVLNSLIFVAYTADLKNTIKSQFAMLYNNSSNAVLLKEDLPQEPKGDNYVDGT